MRSVEWCRPQGRPVEWLGEATKSNWTPLEKEMIQRKGGTNESDFKAYGKIAGTIGGAAACAATGIGTAVAVGCGFVGGIIGGIIGGAIGKQVKIITGKSDEEKIANRWNLTVTAAEKAAKGILTVKTYLTLRDYALSVGYSEAELVKAGLPPAPIKSRWKPSAARYQAAQQNWQLVQQYAANGGQKSNDCSIAKSLGITNDKVSCADFMFMAYWNGAYGPVSPASDSIDYYAVGRDQANAYGYDCKVNMSYPTTVKGKFLDSDVTCPTSRPTEDVLPLIAKIKSLPKVKDALDKGELPVASGGDTSTNNPVVAVTAVAIIAGLVWFFL